MAQNSRKKILYNVGIDIFLNNMAKYIPEGCILPVDKNCNLLSSALSVDFNLGRFIEGINLNHSLASRSGKIPFRESEDEIYRDFDGFAIKCGSESGVLALIIGEHKGEKSGFEWWKSLLKSNKMLIPAEEYYRDERFMTPTDTICYRDSDGNGIVLYKLTGNIRLPPKIPSVSIDLMWDGDWILAPHSCILGNFSTTLPVTVSRGISDIPECILDTLKSFILISRVRKGEPSLVHREGSKLESRKRVTSSISRRSAKFERPPGESIGSEVKRLTETPSSKNKFLNHIRNIWCRRDENKLRMVLEWLSRVMKYPETRQKILMIAGDTPFTSVYMMDFLRDVFGRKFASRGTHSHIPNAGLVMIVCKFLDIDFIADRCEGNIIATINEECLSKDNRCIIFSAKADILTQSYMDEMRAYSDEELEEFREILWNVKVNETVDEDRKNYINDLLSGVRKTIFLNFEGVRGKFIKFEHLYTDYLGWRSSLDLSPITRNQFLEMLENRIGKKLVRKEVTRCDGKKCRILGVFEADLRDKC